MVGDFLFFRIPLIKYKNLFMCWILSKKYFKLNSTVRIRYHALYGEINANKYIFPI